MFLSLAGGHFEEGAVGLHVHEHVEVFVAWVRGEVPLSHFVSHGYCWTILRGEWLIARSLLVRRVE